jgi:hypothetical protein
MTETGDIDLPPNEEVEVLLKFHTIREVPTVPGDAGNFPPQAFIRPRKIIVVVM